jgi:hypothetical protein
MFNKSVVAIAPASVASNATAGLDIDTRGARWTQINVIMPTTTANLSTLKVQAGDTTSTYADVVALTGGTAVSTSAGFVIPTFNSAAATTIRFSINKLNVPQRYLKLQVTPAAAAVIAAQADVLESENDVLTTTQQNVSAHVIV